MSLRKLYFKSQMIAFFHMWCNPRNNCDEVKIEFVRDFIGENRKGIYRESTMVVYKMLNRGRHWNRKRTK